MNPGQSVVVMELALLGSEAREGEHGLGALSSPPTPVPTAPETVFGTSVFDNSVNFFAY